MSLVAAIGGIVVSGLIYALSMLMKAIAALAFLYALLHVYEYLSPPTETPPKKTAEDDAAADRVKEAIHDAIFNDGDDDGLNEARRTLRRRAARDK